MTLVLYQTGGSCRSVARVVLLGWEGAGFRGLGLVGQVELEPEGIFVCVALLCSAQSARISGCEAIGIDFSFRSR